MLSGKTFSHYRVLEKIGHGGMGEVFLATDTILGRRVALKFLTHERDAADRDRILEEARAAASIDHPYVCKVFETGEFEDKPFIAMEFVEGETLAKRLAEGSMPLQRALPLAIEIAEALAEAHGHGIVHCDLKPPNVMITRGGHVKLMDFGLARPIEVSGIDETQIILPPHAGTPAYMSPEQARGESLDARTDVFALGILFFEMLTGAHPFKRATMVATVAAILHDDPPPIQRYLATSDSSLQTVLNRALARNLTERYDSAAEFAADLIALRERRVIQSRAPSTLTIAILPFKDLSAQHDQEYFCDGLADELIVTLGKIEGLRTVSRSAAFRYRHAEIGLPEIGKALGATTILEGSVRKAGNRLRIVLNLVDLGDGCPAWSERYDRELNDIFEVQDEIARSVAEKLRVTFKPAANPKAIENQTVSVRAYELYLRGRHFWNRRTEDSVRLSIAEFERAIAEDPKFAPAYAGLADAYVTLSIYGAVRPVDAMPLAAKAAERALVLQPDLPEALISRACIHAIFDWDWQKSEAVFESAIRVNPRSAQAHQWFAMNCLAPRRQFARASDALRVAAELEPVSLAIATSLGVLEYFQGNYEEAIARFGAVLDLDQNFYLARYFLGQTLVEVGRTAEAMQELTAASSMARRSLESLSVLGYAKAISGDRAGALAILRELEEREAGAYVSPILIAQVQIGLGEMEEAIGSIKRAFELRSTDLIWLNVRPAFREATTHGRVVRILRKAGLIDQR